MKAILSQETEYKAELIRWIMSNRSARFECPSDLPEADYKDALYKAGEIRTAGSLWDLEIPSFSPFTCEFVYLDQLESLPSVSGVYFALGGNQVQYVGQSANLKNRWKHHYQHGFVASTENPRISFLRCDRRIAAELERLMIFVFNPLLNKTKRVNRVWDSSALIADGELNKIFSVGINIDLSKKGTKAIASAADITLKKLKSAEISFSSKQFSSVSYAFDRKPHQMISVKVADRRVDWAAQMFDLAEMAQKSFGALVRMPNPLANRYATCDLINSAIDPDRDEILFDRLLTIAINIDKDACHKAEWDYPSFLIGGSQVA